MAGKNILRFFECLALLLLAKVLAVLGSATFSASWLALWLIGLTSYLLGAFALFRLSKCFLSIEMTESQTENHQNRGRANSRVHFLRRCRSLFFFTAAGFLLYFPDTVAAFASEASLFLSIVLTVVAWVFVTCLLMPLRFPLVLMQNSQHLRLGYVFLLPLLELSLLSIFPLAYFGAMPAPVPPAALHASASFGPSGSVTLIVDPRFDEDMRKHAAQEAEEFQLAKTWFFLDQLFADIHRHSDERLLQLLWPETMFAMGSAGVQTVFSELEKRAFAQGFEKLELIAGVGSALENAVLYITRDQVTGRLRFEKLAQKKSGVPAFEKKVFGLSLYAGIGAESTQEQWGDLEIVGTRSKAVLQNAEIKICYDALFPYLRTFGTSEIVFMNHHIFSRFRFASLTYDYVLRLLSMVFQNDSLLVANQGSSGIVTPMRSLMGLTDGSSAESGRLTIWKRPEHFGF